MSRVYRNFSKTKISKIIYAPLVALTAFGLVLAAPATAVLAASTAPSQATLTTTGAVTTSQATISGTVSDADGVSALSIELASINGSIVRPATLQSAPGSQFSSWSLTIEEAALPVSFTNPNINVTASVVDSSSPSDTTVLPLGSFVLTVADAEVFHSVVVSLASLDPATCPVSAALQTSSPLTLFGPQNSAFTGLPANELAALLDNPDQLCLVVANHIHLGTAIPSTAITNPVQLPTINPTTPPLSIVPEAGKIFVGDSEVVIPDVEVAEGILHVVSNLLKPVSSAVSIAPFKTSSTSPAISGTVSDPTATVFVRVNGTVYLALNNGDGTWSIPAGSVLIDPQASNTLFTVVAYSTPTDPSMNPVLLGVTMRDDVLTYEAPVVTQSLSTQVTPTITTAAVVSNTIATSDAAVSQEQPSPANETKNPEEESNDQASKPEEKNDDSSNAQWYWWVIGVATLGALYYVLGGTGTVKPPKNN